MSLSRMIHTTPAYSLSDACVHNACVSHLASRLYPFSPLFLSLLSLSPLSRMLVCTGCLFAARVHRTPLRRQLWFPPADRLLPRLPCASHPPSALALLVSHLWNPLARLPMQAPPSTSIGRLKVHLYTHGWLHSPYPHAFLFRRRCGVPPSESFRLASVYTRVVFALHPPVFISSPLWCATFRVLPACICLHTGGIRLTPTCFYLVAVVVCHLPACICIHTRGCNRIAPMCFYFVAVVVCHLQSPSGLLVRDFAVMWPRLRSLSF
jgi:hypothetical protein